MLSKEEPTTTAPTFSAVEARRRSAAVEQQVQTSPDGFRVLTGDRPTACQVLTDRDVAENLKENVQGLVLDNLSVGLDPSRSTIFTHSAIPALNQLLLPFLSLVSVAELGRNLTVKDEITHSRRCCQRFRSSWARTAAR